MNLTTDVKVLTAVIGAGAVVAIGALSMALTGPPGAPKVSADPPGMTMGSTSTQTTPANAPEVSVAVPAIKGPPGG